ncbi:hypothetical protein IFM47457_08771 [Aspergillus lentulus]|nr:hypothetical protein IFM47457_08771 [Aspergillus lentulus]
MVTADYTPEQLVKVAAYTKEENYVKQRQTAVAAKLHYYAICNVSYQDNASPVRHNRIKQHLKKKKGRCRETKGSRDCEDLPLRCLQCVVPGLSFTQGA